MSDHIQQTADVICRGHAMNDCYGRQPHTWGAPVKSEMYGCTVKACSRCGRVSRVDALRAATPKDGER